MSAVSVSETNRYGIKKRANLEANLGSYSSVLLNVQHE